MISIAPFPPTPLPLDRFLIEPGQDPEAGDYVALGGYWWRVTDVDGPVITTQGGAVRVLKSGEEIPIARVCCRTDTRYRRT